MLLSEGVAETDLTFHREMDMRYIEQSYELRVTVPSRELSAADQEELASGFYAEHERSYGYATRAEPCELVNLRLTAVGSIRQPTWRELETGSEDPSGAIKTERDVYFSEVASRVPCKIFDRYQLRAGNRIAGPAIVEQIDSTVVIHPNYTAEVDGYGNLLIVPE